jgi:hypothetical protein
MGFVRSPPKEDDKEDDEDCESLFRLSWQGAISAIGSLNFMAPQIGYKFDDEKVSPVRREQITALEGGGEDSVAYILLYRWDTACRS